jgi:hypothetical protein
VEGWISAPGGDGALQSPNPSPPTYFRDHPGEPLAHPEIPSGQTNARRLAALFFSRHFGCIFFIFLIMIKMYETS